MPIQMVTKTQEQMEREKIMEKRTLYKSNKKQEKMPEDENRANNDHKEIKLTERDMK